MDIIYGSIFLISVLWISVLMIKRAYDTVEH